jgi:hypothetical protein
VERSVGWRGLNLFTLKLTCEVQTLLNVTKAKVWAIMDVARFFLATTKGIRRQDRSNWGRNALRELDDGSADAR